MNNRMKSLLLTSLILCGANTVAAYELKEGLDYDVVPQQIMVDDTVKVYFSFRCGHCAAFDSVYYQVSQHLPDQVCLTKIPIFSLHDELDLLYAKSFAVAQQNGVEFQYTREMFEALKNRQAPKCVKTMTQFFAKPLNIKPSLFKTHFEAKETENKLAGYLLDAERLEVKAVPTVIVGNTYHVTPKRVTSFEEYKVLIQKVVGKHIRRPA
ncbi:thioredoxin domain-containing protein [Vibrio nigripulchritudo]|uniref:thioredoxin domain-containing protein n=1 Tax=Vibrio nigripulchritudo TaxID=28173 RepID=UPI001909A934|nr:thioredoxin domain-containing protein [Vibrio nigripulchritudo]